jgi:lipopolysaccharide export system protein LptC
VSSPSQAWLDRFVAWSPALLLGALAALTYWLNAQIRVGEPVFDGSNRHDPDVFVENFRAINLDKDGHIRQSLDAKRADHFPDDDNTALQAPRIAFTEPDKPRLDVASDRAVVTGNREHAYFEGHVKAVREPTTGADGKTEGPITFESEYLHVIPKADRIETDRPVKIYEPRGSINATGLEYDNKTKLLKLKSKVSGQIQPQSVPQ